MEPGLKKRSRSVRIRFLPVYQFVEIRAAQSHYVVPVPRK